MVKKVRFISMDQGTKEDYDLVAIHDSKNEKGLYKRVIKVASNDGRRFSISN